MTEVAAAAEEAPPRFFEAPDYYNPGDEKIEQGHVLLITNTEFPLGKWPPVPNELNTDHDGLKNFWDHDFIGKIPSSNFISLRNPTTTEVLSTLDLLTKKVTPESFLVIYIATNIITINKANKDVPKENAYFAFRNSIWSPNKHAETMDTCIPLIHFATHINQIPCQEKTLFINFALTPPQRKTLFVPAKVVYPPDDFAERLSNLCRAPVLTSCANGFSVASYAKAHPVSLYDEIFVRRRLYRSDPHVTTKGKKGKNKKKVKLHEEAKPQQLPGASSSLTNSLSSSIVSNVSVVPTTTLSVPPVIPGNTAPKSSSELFKSSKWQQFLVDWELPPEKPIRISPRPDKPAPRWESQGIGAAATLKVEIPSEAEVTTYQRRLLYWRTKRTLAKPVNFLRETYRYQKKIALHAPREYSLIFNGHTIFAKSIMDTIRMGLACISSEDAVRLDTVYYQIYKEMKKQVKAIHEKQALDEELEKQRIAAAIAEEEDRTGAVGVESGENSGGNDLSDTVQRKKGKGGTKVADKRSGDVKSNKKDKKKKDQKKKDKKAKEAAAAKQIIAQTPALYFPTIGVMQYKKSSVLSMMTALISGSRAASQDSAPVVVGQLKENIVTNKKPVFLTTSLALPFMERRIFFRCGLPPAPERPFITVVTRHTVALTWYNPPFDGIAPLYYRLQMGNVSRNFHDWQYVRLPGGPSDAMSSMIRQIKHFEEEEEDRRQLLGQGYAYYCIKSTSFVVRDLPMGIACRFRVQAFNPGGWSTFSEPSDFVTPGEEQIPVPSYMLWRRLTQSGCLGILDRLKRFPHNADEQREGMRRLAAFGNNNHGFLKTPIALSVAEHCVHNLRQFPDDPELIKFTLNTMIWTLSGNKTERKVRFYYTQNPLPLSIEDILLMKEIRKRRSSIADAIQKAAADAADIAASSVANVAVLGDQMQYQKLRREAAHGNANANEQQITLSPEEAAMQQMQSLIGILTLIWQRWRHHSGVVNAFQGLRGAGGISSATSFGRYLDSIGLVSRFENYLPPVNFPPPETEGDTADDWLGDDDEEGISEEDVAAMEEMLRERQAALQAKEKQEHRQQLLQKQKSQQMQSERGKASKK